VEEESGVPASNDEADVQKVSTKQSYRCTKSSPRTIFSTSIATKVEDRMGLGADMDDNIARTWTDVLHGQNYSGASKAASDCLKTNLRVAHTAHKDQRVVSLFLCIAREFWCSA
jgi:hypothetical protein